ncbi:uncharacterized protein An09g00910 [Aspergillus niger]|uniref:Contig An09c0040, genomic contig n=2 Tax=Aspergillus niger TaxID=5061 RepID=A2QT59_ASPNC|nr:uncharacterized protein An09g00910 [Aspergillus niger]CAK49015.1 unnamed protein product [Aspergillus niger]
MEIMNEGTVQLRMLPDHSKEFTAFGRRCPHLGEGKTSTSILRCIEVRLRQIEESFWRVLAHDAEVVAWDIGMDAALRAILYPE